MGNNSSADVNNHINKPVIVGRSNNFRNSQTQSIKPKEIEGQTLLRIRNCDGNTFETIVLASDTIGSLKQNIFNMRGGMNPSFNIRLTSSAGEVLDDSLTIAESKIESGSELHVQELASADGGMNGNASLLVEQSSHLEGEVETRTGVRVYVALLGRKEPVSLQVRAGDLVVAVKEIIRDVLGYPVEKQRLIANNVELEDEQSLERYITSTDESGDDGVSLHVQLVLRPTVRRPSWRGQIFVKTLTGQNFSLDVEHANTLAQIKDLIYAQEGIVQERQKLTFSGKVLQDDKSLADSNIQNENTLLLKIE